MKIQSVTHNNRKRAFQVKMSKKLFQLPYSKVDPQPSPANQTVNGFAVDPENPKAMYVAMRDALFKSMDAGQSWKRIGNDLKNLAAVNINPKKPKEICVSTADGAIFISADAGMNWKTQQ